RIAWWETSTGGTRRDSDHIRVIAAAGGKNSSLVRGGGGGKRNWGGSKGTEKLNSIIKELFSIAWSFDHGNRVNLYRYRLVHWRTTSISFREPVCMALVGQQPR